MKNLSSVVLVGLLAAAAGSSHAAGVVDVKFIDAAHYSDAGFGALATERTTKALGAKLQQLGAALPDGQTLHVEVLDVDLAGSEQHGARRDLRVLHGRTDWPMIHLRYTLTAGAKTLASGDERLQDLDYLGPNSPALGSAKPYYYEERLLSRWFEKQFEPTKAQ